jgi:predicted permease
MARAKGFTAAVVLTLALGLALCTTALVVVNAYLFSNLPYPAAERLYTIRYAVPGHDQPRRMETLDWISLSDIIEHPIAWDLDAFYLLGGENAEMVPGAWVTPGFVEGLGIHPVIGRGFDASAFQAGTGNVALISHRLWQVRFGGDPAAVGRTFTAYVSDRPEEAERFTVIGVLPPDLWHFNPYTDILTPLRAPTYPYMVRLRPGVTPEHAAERITTLVVAGAASVPQNWSAEVQSAHGQYVASVRPLLRTVTTAAALVLLVACANVATLFLVRATRRRKEIAVRNALGAGRWVIARMLLAEALVVGITASALALFATVLTLDAIAPVVQQQLGRNAPRALSATALDLRLSIAAFGVGILTTVVCALAPLLTSLRPRLAGSLHGEGLPRALSSGRGTTDGAGAQRIRTTLIAVEIAVSVGLVTGSALMIRSVVTLIRADLGFAGDRILNASVTLRQNTYPDAASRLALFERMSSRLLAVPGVESVGLTTAWPLQQGRLRTLTIAGAPGDTGTRAAVQSINDEYFASLQIPVLVGRAFTRADRLGSEPVAVISDTLARRLWPAGSPLGKTILIPEDRDDGEPVPVVRRVVGVVADVRQIPGDVDLADAYVPVFQTAGRFVFALIRTGGAPEGWPPQIRVAFRDIDPEIAVQRSRPLAAAIDEATARPRFLTWLLTAFALIAALLALIGAYGVIAYAVRQREREIAVRLAVGADPARITRLFLRQGSWILAVGLAAGILIVLAGGRLLDSQLFGITARDPLTLAVTVTVFAGAGLLAVWWPARRASRTDPALALRAD